MTDPGHQDHFGCARCWPDSAEAAWAAREGLPRVADLVDESHFHVMILACPDCAQRFVSVFTETIDWVDSEDPQYVSVLPITAVQADDLIQRRESLAESDIEALGPGRRCLRHDFPKREPKRCYWGTGLLIGTHD